MGAAIDLQATYTEADPNGRLTQSTVTATFTGVKRDENAYLYKDWGAAYFADFVHDFETTGVTWANGSKLVVWGVSDTVAAMSGWTAGLYLLLNATSTTAGTYTLGEVGGAAGTSVGASIAKTIMYWRIERNGTTLTAKRASSAANRIAGVFVETLTIACANTTYRYQFAGSTFNDANTTAVTQTTANWKGTKMTSAGTPFDTAYMAGASSGNWDAGTTWGNAGSTKGTDYPGTAADVVSIDVGDTVTYNVSETNELGDIAINGILSFKKDSSTKLVLGNNNINVASGGELRVGNDADPIGAAYTTEIYFTTTADQTKGILPVSGSTLNIVGSDLTGGTLITYLTANWTAGKVFTVKGDVTAKWANGQKVFVYRFQSAYQSASDTYEYTIASMAANGADTDITIVEAAPGITFRAGGIVAHGTRNIIIGKMSASAAMDNYNTNRPYIVHTGTTRTASLANIKHVSFHGLMRVAPSTTGRLDMTGVLFRNCYSSFGNSSYHFNSVFTNCLHISTWLPPRYLNNCTVTGGAIMDSGYVADENYGCTFNNLYFVNNTVNNKMISTSRSCTYRNVDFVGSYAWISAVLHNIDFINCCFGLFRHHANTSAPTYGMLTPNTGDRVRFINCKFDTDPPNLSPSWWNSLVDVKFFFDDFNGTLGDTRTFCQYFTTQTNTTVTRGGGSSVSLAISRMDGSCPGSLSEPVFEWVEWDVPASAQTRKIYIRGGNGGAEDWSTYPTAAELFLEAEYYDAAGTCHKAFAVSTDVLTDNTTWTAFNLSFAPGRVGQVVYRLRLGLVTGVASVKLYVDPQLNS